MLTNDEAVDAETRPLDREIAWPLWGLLAACAVAVQVMGQNLLHVRDPSLWLAGLFMVSVVFTMGVRWLLGSAERLSLQESVD